MTKRILIAEDEDDLRNLVKIYLEPYDLEILEAEDGEVAIQIAKEQKPDLILCDNNMPGLTGYEVLQKLKGDSDTRKIPIVMVTGKKFDEGMQMMIKLDAADFIPKPYEEDKIISVITKILGPLSKKEEHQPINEGKFESQTEEIIHIATPLAEKVEIKDNILQQVSQQQVVSSNIKNDVLESSLLPPEFAVMTGIEQKLNPEKSAEMPSFDTITPPPADAEILSKVEDITVQPTHENDKIKIKESSGVYLIKNISFKQVYALFFSDQKIISTMEKRGKMIVLVVPEVVDIETIKNLEELINLFSLNVIFIHKNLFESKKNNLLSYITEIPKENFIPAKFIQYLL
ncbi:MAG: response regulator [Endomicrobia bacterium]|nr:response regulator [Endomicrobiia bacterium]